MAGYSAYVVWAEQQGFVAEENPTFGLNDPSVAGMRCFIGFHKDHRQTVELAGKLRTLTHKQVAMHGLISRVAVTGEKATVTALAKEANVVPSTLSRFLDKLEVWHVYAIDRTRGRNGGIVVKLRTLGDQLYAYAERAWARVRKAAEKAFSRTKVNVASSIPTVYEESDSYLATNVVLMDATFSEAWDDAERAGRVLVEQIRADKTTPLPRSADSFNPGRLTAANVIAERFRLALLDPEGEREALKPLG